jgi:hypothetical protein|tara:strand:- start:79 stop:312 length:234 start_codon:yes stop_codon:yes gene_type:complete
MKRTRNVQNPMVLVSLRIPKEIVDYFQTMPNYTMEMREVLKEYVEQQKGGESQQGRLMMINALREELANRNEEGDGV